jgi:hypothetical protein
VGEVPLEQALQAHLALLILEVVEVLVTVVQEVVLVAVA